MKIVSTLPIAAALVLTACAESGAPLGPAAPNFQLVDGYGLQVEDGNVSISAQFGFTESSARSVDQYVGPGVNEDGKEIGWCQFGRWRNPAGKFTGSVPHAHCMRVVSAASQDVIMMEPISGRHSTLPGNVPVKLVFGNEGLASEYRVQFQASQNRTQATGLLVAHALRNGVRTGKFVFDLAQLEVSGENLLVGRCYVGDRETSQEADVGNWRHCLNYETADGQLRGAATAYYFADVNADHRDVSRADRVVNGFVYWQ
jgi:hypothetical protein